MELMINRELRKEIQLKLAKIEGNPKYFQARKESVIKSLCSLGDIYSFWIENPDLRKDLLLEKKQPKTLKKMARKGISNIKNGWYYLHNQHRENTFIAEFNEDILKRVNGLIEPKIYGTGNFRKKDVTLNIKGYTPVSWEKVPEKVDELIFLIKDLYNQDPLESAIAAHLGFAWIQPFIEGNKRTARLIQDRILHSEGTPPSIIPAGESKFYFDLLKRIFPTYNEKDKNQQRQFYDYCASKINNGLDEILGDLKV